MEEFNDYFEEETTPAPRSSAPFADSPYEFEFEPEEEEPAAKKPARVKKKGSALRRTVAAVLALALVAGGCGITYSVVNNQWEQKAAQDAAAIAQLSRKVDSLQNRISAASLRGEGGTVIAGNLVSADGTMTPRQVYADNSDSVVAISCSVTSTSIYGQTSQGTSTGSGFILTEDGYVVTNYHVIEGATSVKVITNDRLASNEDATVFSAVNGKEYEATVVGHDSINDVAVLKIEAEGLPAVTLGRSDDLFIGDMVCAIGNPLGSLTATLTVGYVSGKDRQITTDSTMINMIQTDAAINAGNSGGPLFNMYGEVVGITTAKYSGTTSSGASIEGIGFAIPIDDVMGIIGDLQNFGYVTGAYLGVTVQDTDASAASLYGLPTGAYVVSVVENGAADRAGVQEKDIIIAIGDISVSNVTELTRSLRRFKANDVTTITVIRSGERVTLDITLDEKPRDLNSTPAQPEETMPANGSYEEWYRYFFGDTEQGG